MTTISPYDSYQNRPLVELMRDEKCGKAARSLYQADSQLKSLYKQGSIFTTLLVLGMGLATAYAFASCGLGTGLDVLLLGTPIYILTGLVIAKYADSIEVMEAHHKKPLGENQSWQDYLQERDCHFDENGQDGIEDFHNEL